MFRPRGTKRTEDETQDSGAETAGSDCSKMSCSGINLMTDPDQEVLPVTMHLLTNPGDSLMLQHTLDRLLKWVCPGLRLFHVSERACPLPDNQKAHLSSVTGHPSHAVTLFLHESYGEKRIRKALEFLQCPPWQYHHTEMCGGRVGDMSFFTSFSSELMTTCLLPSRDFYSLGMGMPVWGVRTVHYGEEMVRVTLHCTYDNFEDTVRLYETVLQKRVEDQKQGFCWFTLFTELGFSLQLAIKQLSPGVRVEPCYSSVMQFRVGKVGQLVPLLPNPCSPISATRWHTEDLDGNKILFQVSQVKSHAQPQRYLTSAFPLSCPSLPSRPLLRNCVSTRSSSISLGSKLSHVMEHAIVACPRMDLPSDSLCGLRLGACDASESTCSSPPGSSCYSSQRSSPAGHTVHQYEPTVTTENFVSSLLLEKPECETNVDSGCAVNPLPNRTERASDLETKDRDLKYILPKPQGVLATQKNSEIILAGPESSLTQTQASQCHGVCQHAHVDEFFI